jgi:integrase
MLEPFYPELKRGNGEKVWAFDYPQFVREFNKCLKELGITLPITPYQTRHSGPSVDVARGLRDLVQVQRRGQWRTTQSVQRYEKEARLTESWHLLPADTQALLLRCESHLADVLYGRPHGLALL